MKRAKRIVLSLLTALLLVFSFSVSFAEDTGVAMLSSEMLSKFKVVSTEIMTGTDKGFEETKTLTRAEVATIIIRLSGYLNGMADGITLDDVDYADVPSDHWAKDYIALATKLGLVRGTGNGNFAPDDLVTIQEVETMVCRAIGAAEYIDAQGEWPQNYMDFSHEHGIDEYITKIGPDDSLRINTAVIIANVLDLLRGHVETNSDGSKSWVFDEKTVAEDNLGVRLVVNKTCQSVKSGSFNGITVKDGVDLSDVKSGVKYDYYINDKNVIVGIWPSELKEEAAKEQELIDKGIDPHTLLGDKDQEQKEQKETKKHSSGPVGPTVVYTSSITSNTKLVFNEDTQKNEIVLMDINGMDGAIEGTDAAINNNYGTNGDVVVKYELKDNYTLKGTNITTESMQKAYPYVINKDCDKYLKLEKLEFENTDGNDSNLFYITYHTFDSIISKNQINSVLSSLDDNQHLEEFLYRGVKIKSVDKTNKIIVFETIGDGIYFDDTEDHYIATLPLQDNEIVYAKVSGDKRQLEVKWGTKVNIDSDKITTVVYTAKNVVRMPNISTATRTPLGDSPEDQKAYDGVTQHADYKFTAPTGYTFKNVALTPATFGGDANGVITKAFESTYGIRVITEYIKEDDAFKVTVVSFGEALNLSGSNVTAASMLDGDILKLPAMYSAVKRVAKKGEDDFTDESTVKHGDEIKVSFTPDDPVANSFNGAAEVTKAMLTGNTDGKVDKTDSLESSVYAQIESLTFDVDKDTYNVTFKVYGKKIKPLNITPGKFGDSLGADKFQVPAIEKFTAKVGETQVENALDVTSDEFTVTYVPEKEYQVDDTAELTYEALGADTDALYKDAASTYNLKIKEKKIDKDNNVITITFKPELKPFDLENGGSITPATLDSNSKFTIATISPANVVATWDPSGANQVLSSPYERYLTEGDKGKTIKAVYELSTGYTFDGSTISRESLLDGIDTLVDDNSPYAVKIDSFDKDGNKLTVVYKIYRIDDPSADLYPDFEPGKWPEGNGKGNITYSRAKDTLVTFNHKNGGNISTYYIGYFDGVGLENVGYDYTGASGKEKSQLKVKYAYPIENPSKNSKATIDKDNNFTPVAFDNTKVYIKGGSEITSTYTITDTDVTNKLTLVYEAQDKSITNGTEYHTFKDTNNNSYKVEDNKKYFAEEFKEFTNSQVRGPLGSDYYLEFVSAKVDTQKQGDHYSLTDYEGKKLEVVYNVIKIVDIKADNTETDVTNKQMDGNKFVAPVIAHTTVAADKKEYTVTNDKLSLEIKYTPDWGYRFQSASVYQTYFETLQEVYGDHKDWTMTFDSCKVDSDGCLILVYKSGKYGTIPVSRITSTDALTDTNKNTVFAKLVNNGCQIVGTITPTDDEFTVTFKANDYFNFDDEKGDTYKSLISIPNYTLDKVEVTREQLVLTFKIISGGQI